MGAAPGEAYVQLGVPEGRTEAELLELADGLAAVAAAHGVAIAGGDVTRAPALLVAVTVVGFAAGPDELVRRARRRPRRPGRGHRRARRRRGGPAAALRHRLAEALDERAPRRCDAAS